MLLQISHVHIQGERVKTGYVRRLVRPSRKVSIPNSCSRNKKCKTNNGYFGTTTPLPEILNAHD